jgi:hypothetical protein
MTIENEVAALTTATTTLLSAVNVAKSTLDASTASASTSAIAASASAATTASAIVTERTSTATLTNKTLTNPVINAPTGIVKADVGLSNVDNTSDVNKPISSAQATAIATKQPLDADLTAIAALAGTTGLLKKTALDTWTLDTTSYPSATGGNASGTWGININGTVGATTPAAGSFTTLSAGNVQTLGIPGVTGSYGAVYWPNTAGQTAFWSANNNDSYSFGSGTTHGVSTLLRLSATGLSVTGGISSTGDLDAFDGAPEAKRRLKITNTVYYGAAQVGLQLINTSTNNSPGAWDIYADGSTGNLEFARVSGANAAVLGSKRLSLSAEGNLGLGVVPSAWGSTWKSMQIGIVGSIAAQTNTTAIHVSSNEYINSGGTSTYIAGDFAGKYRQISGQHSWYVAPSGTAGQPISFSQAMTLDASGNLLVGTTSALFGVNASIQANSNGKPYAGIFSRPGAGALILFGENGVGGVGTIAVTTSTTSYNTSSDYRLKNITGPVSDSGAYIDSLKPVQGTWKADGSTFVGLIAHEAQEASRTNVATGTKDGDEMQGMDYSSAEIIANLIAEIQSLRQRLATAGI